MPLKPLPKKRVIRKLSGTELPPLIVGRERSESVAIMKKKIVKKKRKRMSQMNGQIKHLWKKMKKWIIREMKKWTQ